MNIFTSIADILVLIVVFGFTIFVHELGHFLLALKLGFVVDTFSIGFGPAIWKKKIKGIVFKISWIPLGGYVALPQLDPEGMDVVQGDDDSEEEERQVPLPPAEPWKRIVVSVFGPLGNIVFALILAWIVYLGPEVGPPPVDGVIVGHVETNAPAYASGIARGDRIIAVNDKTVNTWYDYRVESLFQSGKENQVTLTVESGVDGTLSNHVLPTKEIDDIQTVEGIDEASPCIVTQLEPGGAAETAGLQAGDVVMRFDNIRVASIKHLQEMVAERDGKPTPISIHRGEEMLELSVTPAYHEEAERALIGVGLNTAVVMPWMHYRKPSDQIKNDALAITRMLKALATPRESGKAAKGLGGPILILATLWVSIKLSLMNGIGFLRFLNVNLAIINLLPLPVLDGGHIVFALWEMITRRKPHPKFVSIITQVFAVLLIGLMLILTFRDATRLFKHWGSYFKGDEENEQVEEKADADTSDSNTEEKKEAEEVPIEATP